MALALTVADSVAVCSTALLAEAMARLLISKYSLLRPLGAAVDLVDGDSVLFIAALSVVSVLPVANPVEVCSVVLPLSVCAVVLTVAAVSVLPAADSVVV